MCSRWDISTPFFGGVLHSESLWGRQIWSDGCSDTDIQRGNLKSERDRNRPGGGGGGAVQFWGGGVQFWGGPGYGGGGAMYSKPDGYIPETPKTDRKERDRTARSTEVTDCQQSVLQHDTKNKYETDREGEKMQSYLCLKVFFYLYLIRTFGEKKKKHTYKTNLCTACTFKHRETQPRG